MKKLLIGPALLALLFIYQRAEALPNSIYFLKCCGQSCTLYSLFFKPVLTTGNPFFPDCFWGRVVVNEVVAPRDPEIGPEGHPSWHDQDANYWSDLVDNMTSTTGPTLEDPPDTSTLPTLTKYVVSAGG